MGPQGNSKSYESLDKVVVIASLITVALFLRRSSPPQESQGPDIPQAGSTVGMDELWKDSVRNQRSGLNYLPHIPPPPAEPPAPKITLVQAPAEPPPPEPEVEEAPPPRPVPPKPAPKLKPMAFSFSAEAASSANTGAFYSSPKAPPAPRQQYQIQPDVSPPSNAQEPAASPRTGAPRERSWRKPSSR